MFDRAFAEFAGAISSQFGGPYHPSTASWPGVPVIDDGGSIISPGTPINRDCSVQVDSATEAMRQAEGYAEKDVRLIVLGLDFLDSDASLTIKRGPHAGSWSLQSCERDPVAIGWVCRGRQVARAALGGLTGSIVATSALSGMVQLRALLAGASVTSSSVAGQVTARKHLMGAVWAASGLSGSASTGFGFSGAVVAQSAVEASASLATRLSGAVVTASSVTASLGTGLNGAIVAQSGIAGSVTTRALVAGAVVAQSGAVGSLRAWLPLGGLVGAQSELSAALSVRVGVAGAAVASSGLSGEITTSSSASPISAVAADGWKAAMLEPAELAFLPVALQRQGYDATGAATSVSETVVTTKRVRGVWPNQATLPNNDVTLSDVVYSTDTISDVVNNSTKTSPRPIAKWGMLDQFVVGNSIGGDVQPVEVLAFHRNRIAAVRFIISDGANTVEAWVSAMTLSPNTGDKNAVLVYRLPLISIAGLADQSVLTVNAEVYPRVGAAASIMRSADLSDPWLFSPRYFYKHVARRTAPVYVYVNAGTGVDATVNASGVAGSTPKVSTDPAVAKANPFATLHAATGAVRALLLATGLTGGLSSGCIVRVQGTISLGTNWTTGTYQLTNGGCLIIERDPDDASAVVEFGSATANKRQPYVLFRDIILDRVGALAITDFRAQRVEIRNNSQTSLMFVTYAAIDGATVTGGAGSFLAGNAGNHVRMIRGARFTASASFPEPHTIVGCRADQGMTLTQVATRPAEGGVVAFNTFYGRTARDILSLDLSLGGWALIQNLFENIGTVADPGVSFSPDNKSGSLSHILIQNNTILGWGNNYRGNWAYTDGSASGNQTRVHELWSVRGNILPQLNMKTDTFVAQNEGSPGLASTATGNWSQRHGVGWIGNLTMFIDASENGVVQGSNFGRDYGGLKSQNGTSLSTRLDPLFVDDRGPTSASVAGTGIGNYNLTSGSPAIGVLTADEDWLPFDLDGNPRDRGSIGAYR